LSDEVFTKVASERRSKVTFEIEPLGQMVKLTVVHHNFEPGSTVMEMASEGWPHLLPTDSPHSGAKVFQEWDSRR
jgi:hypothetical protein